MDETKEEQEKYLESYDDESKEPKEGEKRFIIYKIKGKESEPAQGSWFEFNAGSWIEVEK